MTVIWSPLALERVSEIGEYIAQDRPQAAADVVEALFASVRRLEQYPESGRHVPESERVDLREVIHDSFRVIYRVDADQVVVLTLTVRHARQELRPDDPDIQ